MAYWIGLIPPELLRNYDILFSKRKSRVSERWTEALQKAVLVFSDQQIITGIAILVAGFAGWEHISVYHWQVVVYLAWMSSNVHLTSLTFLRGYLQKNKVLRLWRLAGMTILFGLLFTSLWPTSMYGWTMALTNGARTVNTGSGPWGSSPWYSMQLPARCFWNAGFSNAESGGAEWLLDSNPGTVLDPNGVLSYIILVLSYLWKATMLFDAGKVALTKWIRDAPLHIFERPLRNIAVKRRAATLDVTKSHGYQFLLSIYVLVLATSDLTESFAGSLWVVSLGLIWGTTNLWVPRNELPGDVRHQEDAWGFGQLLSMLLLLLPLLAVLEHFYGRPMDYLLQWKWIDVKTGLEKNEGSHESEQGEMLGMDQLLVSGDGRSSTTYLPVRTKHTSEPQHIHLTACRIPRTRISQLFLQLDFGDKSTMHALRQAFYPFAVFKAVMWLLNFAIMFSAATVLGFLQSGILGFGWVGIATSAAMMMIMWVVTAAAIPWSRIYR